MRLGRGRRRGAGRGLVSRLASGRGSAAPARIYDCTVRHVRRDPLRNDFSYRTVLWLVDIDRVPRLPAPLRPFTEFRADDHGGDPGVSLRRNIEAYLEGEGIELNGGRVTMLTAPRSLGHVFNPLTVYWCRDPDDSLACVIAEVQNTYGGRHRYLLRPDPDGRAETEKVFYVSPFYPAEGHYRMALPEPDDRLHLSIRYEPPGDDAEPFVAVVRGRGGPVSTASVLRRLMTQPCPTLLTAARIRMQGIKLFLRGLPVVPRACPAKPAGRSSRAVKVDSGPAVADRLNGVYRRLTGRGLPIGVRAWDGRRSGPHDAPTLLIDSPRALRRLVWSPDELGLAQAYVLGELDVEGDVAEGLRRVWAQLDRNGTVPRPRPAPAARARLLATALRLGALGPRPAAPGSQARMSGRAHTLARDRAVIAHHYDLSNDFYALFLDDSMSYSSAYWASDDPGHGLDEAQRDKLDLICRKLGLQPGMRLLDVGCGWGGLMIHAAENYGVTAVGLTLSRNQASYINDRLEQRGLGKRVEVRVQHFREFSEPRAFDAAASIEMGEHVGAEAYPVYTRMLHDSLKAGGRALIQQMSRAHGAAPGGGPFIESFIAPDMHMRPLDETVAQWRAAGFEVLGTQSLREDYVRTVGAWRERLEQAWPKAVALAGSETARVWRLYLAGGRLALEQGRMGVDQILAVRSDVVGH